MKITLLLLGTLATLCAAGRAQAPAPFAFEIKNIKRGTNSQVFVDKAWKRNVPVIEVDVRTHEDLQGKKPFIRAYFYDREKKLILKANAPSPYTVPGKGTVNVPDYLKPKETYLVCFGIPDQALDVQRKWARVLVVFGEGNRAVAEVYPPDGAAPFEFDEKSFATEKGK